MRCIDLGCLPRIEFEVESPFFDYAANDDAAVDSVKDVCAKDNCGDKL